MGMTGHKMDNGATIWFNSSDEEIAVEKDGVRISIDAKWIWMFVEGVLRSAKIAEAEQMTLSEMLGVEIP